MALLTDLYELTMAAAYWKSKMADHEAVFHLFFRRQPFGGGYCIAAGLESVIDYLQNWHFDISDLDYLASLKSEGNEPLFEEGFLNYLRELKFDCDIDGICEGEVVFPFEPMLRVTGSLLQAQLLESALLSLINFPSLIATKAARICFAAAGDEVIEFGLRRAQGVDGALTASRASFIGGCSASSNTLAGKRFGIPVRGTHAHSWVMAFESEQQSFKAYAEAMPHNAIFLVDTYDSIQGIEHAIEVGKWLKAEGRPFWGIRLDSGDINYLSNQARNLLDEAGFSDAKIVASNELNETLIADLKRQGAKVAVWGVGTHLVTGQSQPALDGVYKLSAIRKRGESKWEPKLKFSERMTKISDPGILQVRRYFDPKLGYVADAIYDVESDLSHGCEIVDPQDAIRTKRVGKGLKGRDLLIPIFRKGKLVYQKPTIGEIQTYGREQLSHFDDSIKRFYNPHNYPVGMEHSLYQTKLQLIEKIKHARTHHC